MKTFFTIITPTYNRASSGYLEKCIESVLNQSEGNFEYEHLIIDDGSTDKTSEVVGKYIKEDKRIKYFFKKNGGSASSWKYGISKAKGDYVTFLDDDDLLAKDSLKKRSEHLKKTNSDWFYAKAEWINEKDEVLQSEFQSEYYKNNLYEKHLISNVVHGGTPVVKREVLSSVKWPLWLKRSQDYFLWLELLRPEKGIKVSFLDDFVYQYRIHNDSYSTNIKATLERFGKKELLNQKIRLLHGDSLAFLANEVYVTRKELWEAYRTVQRLDIELGSIKKNFLYRLYKKVNNIVRLKNEKS